MSPNKIRVLSDHIINQIAAGEVIENPASVVKELVENSLDAGSTSIYVEIIEGGRQLIRVADNGSGMSKDDALLSLERHATSKIADVSDIESLLTMGFRGEAVPSIASISKFTLLTSQGEKGTLVTVDGGKLLSVVNAVRSKGTTIEVKSLFFNVPVRRKFQKSPTYDTQEIVKVLGFLALANPQIEFELICDQKSIFKAKEMSSEMNFQELLEKRIEAVLGREYAQSIIPIKFHREDYQIEGFIGHPDVHKTNRTGQYLFINRRAVISPLISSALKEGYGTLLPSDRFPVFVIHLTLPGSLMDVNVHPQKREVRLRQEQQLKSALFEAVQQAIRPQPQQPVVFSPLKEAREVNEPPPFWGPYASLLSPEKSAQIKSVNEEPWQFRHTPQPSIAPVVSVPLPPTPIIQIQSKQPPRVLTTLVGYFLVESFGLNRQLFRVGASQKEGGLALIDHRAAYARVYYENLLKRSTSREIQSLLIPLTLHLSAVESSILQANLAVLNQMGFSVRGFGEHTFVLDAFPLFIKENEVETLIHRIIQDLMEGESSRKIEAKHQEHLALLACRASLPAAKQLSLEEAQGLLDQLMACEMTEKCPMGRSIALYLSPDELEKLFYAKKWKE